MPQTKATPSSSLLENVATTLNANWTLLFGALCGLFILKTLNPIVTLISLLIVILILVLFMLVRLSSFLNALDRNADEGYFDSDGTDGTAESEGEDETESDETNKERASTNTGGQ